MVYISCEQFDKDSFGVSKIDKNSKYNVNGAYLTFPDYIYPDGKETNFVFKTPEIKITQYGLPAIGAFYQNDSDRSFIKVPLDPAQSGCMKLKSMLLQIDECMKNNSLKRKCLEINHGIHILMSLLYVSH
jgi:hypothetical protein